MAGRDGKYEGRCEVAVEGSKERALVLPGGWAGMEHGYVCRTHEMANCYASLAPRSTFGTDRPAVIVSLEPPVSFVQVEAPAMNVKLDSDLPG
ncbi:hypothetical protein VTN00DRAFT_1165 [Thermoascus crustaceus]|uniref:uncharacterized protein n=1 Tax=Thermoascus crustaceus TaxID=5088 RepID=UPI0037446633